MRVRLVLPPDGAAAEPFGYLGVSHRDGLTGLANTPGSQALEAIAVTLPHLATRPVSRVHSSPRRAPRADIFADSPLPSPSYVKLSG